MIEIDAASHGGVDDARDLRERAFFAPVSSRFKVYIIDEAHMVSSQGFNALLKLVEEPPEHLKFIFATTEPEKVIPTIRSRTHHYPFRLIPPRTLSDYLAELCEKEGVKIDPAALPLVVRAGAGSARDSLSVLDQLLGGAGPDGVTYEVATSLLGYTPDNLLDEVVDAFAAVDGAGVFGVVDKVIETGQDPRRFTEDVLRRLRDLVIVAAVPDASASGLIDAPQDQAERLVAQAARFGKAELVRAADLVASGLTEMRGATTPRLLLELICARLLLPAVDHDSLGLGARLDRLERRVVRGRVASGRPPLAASTRGAARGRAPSQPPARRLRRGRRASPIHAPPRRRDPAGPDAAQPRPPSRASASRDPSRRARQRAAAAHLPAAAPAQPAAAEPGGRRPGGGAVPGGRTADLAGPARGGEEDAAVHLDPAEPERAGDRGRRDQPDRRVQDGRARDSFVGGGSEEILRQAAIDMIGADWKIEVAVDPSADPGSETAPRVIRPAVTPAADRRPTRLGPSPRRPGAAQRTAELGHRRGRRPPCARRAARPSSRQPRAPTSPPPGRAASPAPAPGSRPRRGRPPRRPGGRRQRARQHPAARARARRDRDRRDPPRLTAHPPEIHTNPGATR